MNGHSENNTHRFTLKQRQVIASGLALKHRGELIDLERQVKDIAGKSTDDNDQWRKDPVKFSEVKRLLAKRMKFLNMMFSPDEANMIRFMEVNSRLELLCRQLRERILRLQESLHLIQNPDFDDDYEIDGELRFCYNDENSVLKLDDDYYGSDFCRMIEIISTCNYDTYWECIERVSPYTPSLDDGASWNEPPFYGQPEFDDIIICHAMHNLSGHMGYSLPDILRLNDFWAEAHLTFQSITKQDGTRFTP